MIFMIDWTGSHGYWGWRRSFAFFNQRSAVLFLIGWRRVYRVRVADVRVDDRGFHPLLIRYVFEFDVDGSTRRFNAAPAVLLTRSIRRLADVGDTVRGQR
jgi:hypothetical protein